MHIASQMSEVLGRFLDRTSAQLQVTASNMANVDTPGYKTQGLSFQDTLRMQFDGSDSSGVHTPLSGALSATASGSGAAMRTVPVDGLVSRPDGNNVSMDREGLQLAQSQLQFRAGVELLKREYSRTMSAIHADGK